MDVIVISLQTQVCLLLCLRNIAFSPVPFMHYLTLFNIIQDILMEEAGEDYSTSKEKGSLLPCPT